MECLFLLYNRYILEKTETFDSFYENKFGERLEILANDRTGFILIPYDECVNGKPILYRRRNFYKISFFDGHFVVHYGDKSLETEGTGLIFFDAETPYTIETLKDSTMGGHLIFKKSYLDTYFRNQADKLLPFSMDEKPIFSLDKNETNTINELFYKISEEHNSDYEFKDDLIRNHISELLHFAVKRKPLKKTYISTDAKTRLATVFIELLNRQFPIENQDAPFAFRSPSKFAQTLGVHVNSLNRAVRHLTGKTTGRYISEKLTEEAILLLKHTNWNISEISYSLGFEDPSHFNHFLKDNTKQAPSSFRN